MRPRLFAALLCYGMLALGAGFTLEGVMRVAVWIFLGGLALKTLIAVRLRAIGDSAAPQGGTGSSPDGPAGSDRS